MAIHDFTSERLFVADDLASGARVPLSPEQHNYLRNVMRLNAGDPLLVFNGRDGEWKAVIIDQGKRATALDIEEQTRPQTGGPDLVYLFAPLKRSRLDYMVQKATELGAARLQPVMTQHTVAERVNVDRLRANAIEAAEQCGVLRVPDVADPKKLAAILEDWDESRALIVCDEAAPVANPIEALAKVAQGPIAVLIGPEGGFAKAEREALMAKPYTVAISLGPRIMRADTAAVAALALVNAVLGDWR